jgi:hypothetical protein
LPSARSGQTRAPHAKVSGTALDHGEALPSDRDTLANFPTCQPIQRDWPWGCRGRERPPRPRFQSCTFTPWPSPPRSRPPPHAGARGRGRTRPGQSPALSLHGCSQL